MLGSKIVTLGPKSGAAAGGAGAASAAPPIGATRVAATTATTASRRIPALLLAGAVEPLLAWVSAPCRRMRYLLVNGLLPQVRASGAAFTRRQGRRYPQRAGPAIGSAHRSSRSRRPGARGEDEGELRTLGRSDSITEAGARISRGISGARVVAAPIPPSGQRSRDAGGLLGLVLETRAHPPDSSTLVSSPSLLGRPL